MIRTGLGASLYKGGKGAGKMAFQTLYLHMNRGRRDAPGLGGPSAPRRAAAPVPMVTAAEEGEGGGYPTPYPADGNGITPGLKKVGASLYRSKSSRLLLFFSKCTF